MSSRDETERLIGERERLRLASKLLEEAGTVGERRKEELAEVAKKLPALILNSGLLMTFSYLLKRAQSDNAATRDSARLLVKYLLEWLRRRDLIRLEAPDPDSRDGWRDFPRELMEDLLAKSPVEMAWVSDEVLRFAEGLRILVQALA